MDTVHTALGASPQLTPSHRLEQNTPGILRPWTRGPKWELTRENHPAPEIRLGASSALWPGPKIQTKDPESPDRVPLRLSSRDSCPGAVPGNSVKLQQRNVTLLGASEREAAARLFGNFFWEWKQEDISHHISHNASWALLVWEVPAGKRGSLPDLVTKAPWDFIHSVTLTPGGLLCWKENARFCKHTFSQNASYTFLWDWK